MNLIKTAEEIEFMAEGGRRLARILKTLKGEVRAGVRTSNLDRHALELIREVDCKPAFLGYRPHGVKKPYPATMCVSVNDGVVHCVPSEYVVKEGDVVALDIGLIYKGFYSDAALTVGVGKISEKAKRLIAVTEEALNWAIRVARPGNRIGDIGYAIHCYVEEHGFSVVQSLTGHGIGRELHEEPAVYNFGKRGTGEKLEVGMVLAIEPMVAAGSGKVKQLKDDSFVTADGSLAAHFEHTVAITEKGPEVLTKL